MGKIGAIVGIIFFSWLVYSAYFIVSFHPRIEGEWGAIEGDNVEVIFNVDLGNPSPIPISIDRMEVRLAGIEIGKVERGSIGIFERKARIISTVNLENLTSAIITHIKNDENSKVSVYAKLKLFDVIPVEYSKDLDFKTNLLSYLTNIRVEPRPYTIGPLVVKTPGVEGMSAKWGQVSNDRIEITGLLKLYNPNDFPIPVTGLTAEFYMNNIKIGTGRITKGTVLQPDSRGEVGVKLILDVDNFKEALKAHIRNGERSTLRVDIDLVVKVAGVEYTIPIKNIETTFETDILGSFEFA
ncbi:hypothetical protein PNA2_0732 [Pyrococcus sp. NA2]|uniref:LEA type 2 family protein n=1 Tax=Pyrococcus sp. (strain NA2) TaxID=342949 RepID=UPI000209ADE9|nr:LEA type 2 family protein [Pyrococcus sp. NA2]AEC51648.1 hypothetical protein PNA2_0732 [Pyrococcus sp. NA2]